MKRALWSVWLLTPVAAAAYHFGPGQDRVTLDRAADLIAAAEANASAAEATCCDAAAASAAWTRAIASYDEALRILPPERASEARRCRLEAAKAKTHVSQLPAANSELELLVDELSNDRTTDPALVADARSALANSQYYMTWLMRLEGASRDEWEPTIEAARQNYRWLAETSAEKKDAAALAENERNLEAAIHLARMELAELQGLPLPSQ